jgi:hypothetical protein
LCPQKKVPQESRCSDWQRSCSVPGFSPLGCAAQSLTKIMKPTLSSAAKGHEMTRSVSVVVRKSELDNFLFATIGDDRNDVPLSVLSALARLDVDPWLEAAELARLPRETATQRLASSIAALPDRQSAYLEHGTIAARLIALLPRQANPKIPSLGTLLDAGHETKFRAGMFLFAVLMAFMLAAQWIVVGRQPLAPVDSVQAPTSSTVLPQTLPPNSGK